MKALKLIGVAALVLAVIVGAFWLGDVVQQDNGNGTALLPTKANLALLEDLKDRTAHEWADMPSWDRQLYDAESNCFEQNRDGLGDCYATLCDYRDEIVCNRLDTLLTAQWAKADCSRSVIANDFAGIGYVTGQNAKLSGDARVRRLTDIHALYVRALRLVSRSIGLQPTFNRSSLSFDANAFDNYRRGILAERDAIRRDAHYDVISGITEISRGLNALDGRLAAAFNAYKRSLAAAIRATFDGLEPTQENVRRLRLLEKDYFLKFDDVSLLPFVRRYADRAGHTDIR